MLKKIALISFLFLIPFFSSGQQVANEQKSSFIKVIRNSDRYKLEIADSLLGKDILFGSRVVDISSPNAKVYSAGQMRTPPVLIRFKKDGKYILIEKITKFSEVDSYNPIYDVLKRNEIIGSVMIFDNYRCNKIFFGRGSVSLASPG